ncbi:MULTISPECIES: type VI secretion system-associated FHA domain protein TagH [Pseudomonas]|uniref:type VI secretion system-associated FHA domain protein TagH n=1 Tax=Pseudomonas TaxID=286 RepID=UPI000CD599A1|nr:MULTISPECIES: type VI secretion system-associated FHA domain protein TagH [Pseudomonas]RBH52927.1 type VI secretion system-associated FHA domain protein TagH [Pseudomonas sp. MWU13-2860]
MELVFEIQNTKQLIPHHASRCTFRQAGGKIGRASDCDWVIPDAKRHLSGHHAQVTFNRGMFYLTDLSSNGVFTGGGAQLRKGEAMRVEHGSVYRMGDFEMCARLVRDPGLFETQVGRAQAAGSIIPDDAFLDLDPLVALDRQEQIYAEQDDLTALTAPRRDPRQRADFARIDMESLPLPELVVDQTPAQPAPAPEKPVPEQQSPLFWERFGQALGVDLQGLDNESREAMAIKAARLLAQSVSGLQQSLRSRSELKNELRLAQTTVQLTSKNPLKHAGDSGEALRRLLQPNKPGQLSAEQAIARAVRDLQAHPVALLMASRAAVRATLEHFSPEQLTLRLERDGSKALFAMPGGRWRAFVRYHQALRQDDEWSERLMARDFARAYDEQVRLIATLNTEHQG